MADWIGKVTLENGQQATLGVDGEWRSDNPVLAGKLNLDFNPGRARGVDLMLPFGRMAVSRAASVLKAKATFAEKLEPLPEGAIS